MHCLIQSFKNNASCLKQLDYFVYEVSVDSEVHHSYLICSQFTSNSILSFGGCVTFGVPNHIEALVRPQCFSQSGIALISST